MSQEGKLFRSCQLEVYRNQYATDVKNGIGPDQPLGLVGHQNSSPVAFLKAGLLHGQCHGPGRLLEIGVRQPAVLSLAIRFNQGKLLSMAVNSVPSFRLRVTSKFRT